MKVNSSSNVTHEFFGAPLLLVVKGFASKQMEGKSLFVFSVHWTLNTNILYYVIPFTTGFFGFFYFFGRTTDDFLKI